MNKLLYIIFVFIFSSWHLQAQGLQMDEDTWERKRNGVKTEAFEKEKPKKETNNKSTNFSPPSASSSKDWLKTFQYVALVIVIGLVLWALLAIIIKSGGTAENKNIQKRRAAEHLEDAEANLDEVDVKPLLEQALEQGNYKLAIRLEYLELIQKLNDLNFIQWKKKYTNFDYVFQISDPQRQFNFKQLTLEFEIIWYGDRLVEVALYNKLKPLFDNFNKTYLKDE